MPKILEMFFKMLNENKLKKYRNLKNLTQEELAHQSGISIRTIQRIEKGLASGSPHTLKALARVLEIDHLELNVADQVEHLNKSDELKKLKLLNFSILSVFIIPFGNIILPTLVFLRHRSINTVNNVGRKIISFQIVTSVILFLVSVVIFLLVGRGNGQVPLPVFICYTMIVIVNIIIVIRTSQELNNNKEVLSFFPNLL